MTDRNLMICFCGHPIVIWGHFPVCFFSETVVGSAQLGSLWDIWYHAFVALKIPVPQQERVMDFLLAYVPRHGVFFVLENRLGLMGVAYKEWQEFGDHYLKKKKERKRNKIKIGHPQCSYRTQQLGSSSHVSLSKSLCWHQETSGYSTGMYLVPQKPFSKAKAFIFSLWTTWSISLHLSHRPSSTANNPISLPCELWEVILMGSFPGQPPVR